MMDFIYNFKAAEIDKVFVTHVIQNVNYAIERIEIFVYHVLKTHF
jgi:hypothetical protein